MPSEKRISAYTAYPQGWLTRRRRWEGAVVLRAFGRRIRLYAGSSFFPRPILHRWAWDEDHRGVTLRFSRHGWKRRDGQRVVGIQWRYL